MKLPSIILTMAMCWGGQAIAQEVPISIVESQTVKLPDYDRQILAACLILEASSEGESGMQAVLNVINNRSKGDLFRLCSEVARHGQFTAMSSIWNQNKPNYGPLLRRAMKDRNFPKAVELVRQLERGQLADLTDGSTHYHKQTISPLWSQQMSLTAQIGSHRFYRKESFSTQ